MGAGEHSKDKENRALRRIGSGKRARDEAREALEPLETPVVFSRRKKRVAQASCDGGREAAADTPVDVRLDFSTSTPGHRVDVGAEKTATVSLQPVVRRLTPATAGKNKATPFAVPAKDRLSAAGDRVGSPAQVRSIILCPPGFQNIGNSCYLASVTQCLLGAGAFVGEIKRLAAGRGGPVTRALFDVIQEVDRRDGGALRLDRLKSALASSKHGALFVGSNQSDAHEALLKILECVQEENGDAYRCPFSHSLMITVQCESCGHTARIEERGHVNVTLSMAASAAAHGEGLRRALLARTTEGITKDCERCGNGKDHRRTSLITRMPRVLVVQLARFEFRAVMRKVDDDIAVEKTVNITSDGSKRFELRGVVHHHGQYGDCGHYVCDVLRRSPSRPVGAPSTWFRISDAIVRPTTEVDVLRPSKTSYLLFYDVV